ncbi:aspartate kinase [Pyrococcus furiosus DSM 3638]|uniref:Aspartate kinase n=3 Tax=Pyrococcus furiosus TaxID=2261 RepID=A0A5C0XP27_PYRFU|nr:MULTISPECIES: aspartate kinase [Pyrococcus]AAL81176.1 putative aspartokinase [Pyrococcus furiosus DSM 3638]AFN03848.1 aspartate kinase [Pyrococcus furiosus COM1]MDK2868823.1 aspartate kinase [Pyrococcus sp.]QEK78713.1 aspartate kinase [Pyrococcus furiosus DSM 3638]
MIVLKFGGSSIKYDFEEATNLALSLFEDDAVIVVVSAIKGITDKLILYSQTLDKTIATKIASEYVSFAKSHGIDPVILKPYLDELFNLPDLPEEALRDYILSLGEVLSAVIFSASIGGKFVPSWDIFEAEGNFGNAFIDIKSSKKKFKRVFEVLEEGYIPVIPGFTAGKDGYILTLGRGGSDYSGVAAGVLGKAKLVAIMSDVEGIYTADPKLVPSARLIPYVSYDEIIISSKHGMRALQWKAAELAKEYKIPVLFGRTRNWRMGTLMSERSSGMPLMTYKDGLLLVNVTEEIKYPIIAEGPFWKLYKVSQEEGIHLMRELHTKLFQPSFIQYSVYKSSENGQKTQEFNEKISIEQGENRKIYYSEEEVNLPG